MKAVLFFLTSLIFITPNLCISEPNLGRLADGRAFRVDGEGNQVVDYIAELEATVDSLTRQLASVEQELGSTGNSPTISNAALDCPEKSCPPCQEKEIASLHSCDAPLNELKVSLQNSFNNERVSSQREIDDYLAEISRLKALLDTQTSEIKAKLDIESIAREKNLKEEVGSVQSKIDMLENELDEKNREYDLLKIKNASALKRLEAEKEVSSEPIITAKKEDSPTTKVLVDSSGLWMTSPARVRAMEALKGTVTSEINRLSTRVVTREKLLRSKNSSMVQISSDIPTSSRGNSLEDLRSETQSARSGRELSEIRGEVNEIKSKIEDDIALLSRLNRSR